MNQRYILQYCYLTISARTIRSIWPKNKLEIFIANWSYYYNLKRVFATKQRMRANRTSWAGTRHNIYCCLACLIFWVCFYFVQFTMGQHYRNILYFPAFHFALLLLHIDNYSTTPWWYFSYKKLKSMALEINSNIEAQQSTSLGKFSEVRTQWWWRG